MTTQYGNNTSNIAVSSHRVINVSYHFEMQGLSLKDLWGEGINGSSKRAVFNQSGTPVAPAGAVIHLV